MKIDNESPVPFVLLYAINIIFFRLFEKMSNKILQYNEKNL